MYEKLLLPTIVKDKRTTTTGKDEINTALIKVVLKFLCTIKKNWRREILQGNTVIKWMKIEIFSYIFGFNFPCFNTFTKSQYNVQKTYPIQVKICGHLKKHLFLLSIILIKIYVLTYKSRISLVYQEELCSHILLKPLLEQFVLDWYPCQQCQHKVHRSHLYYQDCLHVL
jgi:hypothetical protein